MPTPRGMAVILPQDPRVLGRCSLPGGGSAKIPKGRQYTNDNLLEKDLSETSCHVLYCTVPKEG